MLNYDAPRFKDRPAAANAVRGYLVLLRLPDKERPQGPGGMWPEYEALNDPYAKFSSSENNSPPKLTPQEVSRWDEWLSPCRWMWQPGWDRKDWKLFQAYARGVPLSDMAAFHNMSRYRVAKALDRIFKTIQDKADEGDGVR